MHLKPETSLAESQQEGLIMKQTNIGEETKTVGTYSVECYDASGNLTWSSYGLKCMVDLANGEYIAAKDAIQVKTL